MTSLFSNRSKPGSEKGTGTGLDMQPMWFLAGAYVGVRSVHSNGGTLVYR
jgi:hypothetical protein